MINTFYILYFVSFFLYFFSFALCPACCIRHMAGQLTEFSIKTLPFLPFRLFLYLPAMRGIQREAKYIIRIIKYTNYYFYN